MAISCRLVFIAHTSKEMTPRPKCHPARAVRLQKAEPSIRRFVELGLKKGKRFSPREWFKLVATAFLISIDIDATVFSIWWWFIK